MTTDDVRTETELPFEKSVHSFNFTLYEWITRLPTPRANEGWI